MMDDADKYFQLYRTEVGEIVPMLGCAIMITSFDLSKMELTARVFRNTKEAIDWKHQDSLSLSPEWHKENCRFCEITSYLGRSSDP